MLLNSNADDLRLHSWSCEYQYQLVMDIIPPGLKPEGHALLSENRDEIVKERGGDDRPATGCRHFVSGRDASFPVF
jgi:hypothetical protein